MLHFDLHPRRFSGTGHYLLWWPTLLVALLIAACSGTVTSPETPRSATERAVTSSDPQPNQMPSSLTALSQGNDQIRFDHLPPAAGLSQSVVLDFAQDDLGFLWLATQDGLNRYDGETFKIFKDVPAGENGIAGNLVYAIEKAPNGDLWIGTGDGGLSRYQPESGLFTRFRHDPQDPNSLSEDSVTALVVDASGIVWVGTSNHGLNRLDPTTGAATRYVTDPNNPASLSGDAIVSLAVDRTGAIWTGTIGSGLNRLDPLTGTFTRYLNNPDDPRSLSENVVMNLYVDASGGLWAGTFAQGLNRFDAATGSFERFLHASDEPTSLSGNSVSSIYQDRAGRLWVGTQGAGLNLLDPSTRQFRHYRHSSHEPASLANDSVMALFEDQAGILWLGTFGAGADYYDPYRAKFLLVQAKPGDPGALSSNSLWGMLEDRQGVLWIGTNDGGLNRFDPPTGKWRSYQNDPADPTSLGHNTVYSVYEDRWEALWLGTAAGLSRLNRDEDTLENYPLPSVLNMMEDRDGRFWLGTPLGLFEFDRDEARIAGPAYVNIPGSETSLSSNGITALFEDAAGRFWVGTSNGGLNRLDRITGKFVRYQRNPDDPHSLSGGAVLAIAQTQSGAIWLGTSNGLDRLDEDPATGAVSFTAYHEQDGLPNEFVYGVLVDEAGHLWLSTNKGLAHFDPATEAFSRYDVSDGLQGAEFNQWSFAKGRDGVMYFGGINGLNAFHPGLVRDNTFVPPIVLTGFQLYHRPVEAGSGQSLPGPIETSASLQLHHTDGFFEIGYASLHFSAPEQIRYAYKMEGLDKDWNEVGNRRFATYTNVPPGRYTFRVKGTNSDGVWNEAGASLTIAIPPPFWRTTWFRVVLGVAVLGLVTGGFALRIRTVEGQRRRLETQVAERTRELRETLGQLEHARDAAEAASRAKSVFLANMSHEFRTPLNAILGFTQIMTRDKRLPAGHREELEIVRRSGEHLLGLINDVLEMSKIEAGRTTLNLRGFDLHRMVEGLEEMFALRASGKGTDLRLVLEPEVPRYVCGDEGKLRQVLMNLLSNAVKFTEQGKVTLSLTTTPQPPDVSAGAWPVGICFAVEDTGPGIKGEDVERLFTPFVQTQTGQEAQEGTGLGLSISQQYVRLMGGEIRVTSRVGYGSTFAFELALAPVAITELDRPPATRQVVGLQPGQPKYRMLVVDDQEVNRKLLVRLLTPVGFEVREAADGREALATWEEWQPHLIWMDMRMPVMDGYEATRRIKATTAGMATIIIALTASALEEDRAVILSEGCDDYMRKPFHEEELFETAARHLGIRYAFEEMAPAKGAAGTQPAATRAGETDALTEQLRAADAGWLTELERAVILGDLDAIGRLTGQIVGEAPDLAEVIAELAKGFEHDRILAAIQAARRNG